MGETHEKTITATDDEEMFVTLDLDDGTTVESRILTIFDIGKQSYIALLPLDRDGRDNADGTVYIYRYFEDGEGNPSIENIQSDDEYDIVADRFDELQDEALYGE